MVCRPIGESLDHRAVSGAPRPASTICLVRDTPGGLEVLMVRRSPEARFMGGAWVFPGGAVDPVDESDAARAAVSCTSPGMLPWVAAAIRELLEETGIWLLGSGTIATSDRPSDAAAYADVAELGERFAGDTLAYFANWITPKPLPVRFDTRFFAVTVPPNLDPVVDRIELVDALWIRPPDALELAGAGEWDIAFPTRKILEFLGGFESAAGLLDNIEHQSSRGSRRSPGALKCSCPAIPASRRRPLRNPIRPCLRNSSASSDQAQIPLPRSVHPERR